MSIQIDGRRQRSERSRERILAALRAALEAPDVDLSPAAVAARAGVSQSTVFRHFGDLDGLADAMRAQVVVEIAPLLAGGFEGDRAARVRELVRRRAAIFAIVGPLERASLRPAPPGHAEDDRRIARALRLQAADALGTDVDPVTAEAIGAFLSLGAWRHLREVRGLDEERVLEILEAGVLGLLDRVNPPGC